MCLDPIPAYVLSFRSIIRPLFCIVVLPAVSFISSVSTASDTGVSFDIAGSTIAAATELLSLGNDSLCNVAPTRYILYKTQTLFQDSNLSANTSVQSEIISAQVGEESLENLQQPAIMSFDLLGGAPVVSQLNVVNQYRFLSRSDYRLGWRAND